MGSLRRIMSLQAKHVSGAQFTYSNSLKSQSIRLLDLKYGREEETIQFDLHTYTLDRTPDYIALSYTWGDSNDTVSALCADKTMRITRNLNKALRQLRKSRVNSIGKQFLDRNLTCPLYFWVDAICINQSDNGEKSFQVSRMADIYQQACKTIVWLGPADESSDSIVDYMNVIGEKAEACGMEWGADPYVEIWLEMAYTPDAPSAPHIRNPSNNLVKESNGGITAVSREALQDLFHSIGGSRDQSNSPPLDDIQRFFTRPWWGRVWVLQEIALPKNVEILCGAKRISRRRCCAFLNAHYALRQVFLRGLVKRQHWTAQQPKIVNAMFHHRPMIMLSSWRVCNYDRFPLAALLRLTCVGSHNLQRHGPHHLESTDPRDKIFALLGVAADGEELRRLGVVPDYSKSKEAIYTTAMAALLEQGHLSLLSFCGMSERSSGLPSWVLDWSRLLTHRLQDVHNDHVTIYPTFNASGPLRPSISVRRKGRDITAISVKCHIYDKVYAVGSFPNRGSSHEVSFLETFTWPTEWLVEILRLTSLDGRSYKELEERIRASARTSIGEVGFSPDFQLERVGDTRFHDAVCLLRGGIKHFKQRHIRSRLQELFDNEATGNLAQTMLLAHQRLGSEIIGKSLARLPCITEKGHLALCSEHVMKGDFIALIPGVQVPFVLRQQHSGQYRIVSEAYVDGIMDGEAMGDSKCQEIEIV